MKIVNLDSGYIISISRNETYNWAHRAGQSWPCSTLSDKSVYAEIDSSGICDIAIDGRELDCDNHELVAMITDFVNSLVDNPAKKFWPVYANNP